MTKNGMIVLLKKEVRTRMRGNSIFVIENAYLMLLAGILLFVLSNSFSMGESYSWVVGSRIFETTNIIQIILLIVAAPTVTASAITLEREQKTFDMLMATPLTPRQIVTSKLLASLSIFFVLALISLPIVAICFIFGGVSPVEIFWGYFLTFEGILLAGAIGLAMSATIKRTIAAVPISTMVVIILMVVSMSVGPAIAPTVSLANPLHAFTVMTSEWNVRFFSLRIPFWLPNIILAVPLFFAIVTGTFDYLETEKRRKGYFSLFFAILYACVLIFGLGSAINPDPLVKGNVERVELFFLFTFFVILLLGIVQTGGTMTDFELRLATFRVKERFFKFSGWFGWSSAVGVQFWTLISFITAVVFALAVVLTPEMKDKAFAALMGGLLIFLCVRSYALLTMYFSLAPWSRGKYMPALLGCLCFALIALAPEFTSFAYYMEYRKPPEALWVTSVFASPMVAFDSLFDPAGLVAEHPYCQKLLGKFPFAAVTNLFYLGFYALASLLHISAVRKSRRRLQEN